MANKFILICPQEKWDCENPECRIRFGNVVYHKDLLTPGNYVFGGGSFKFDEKNKMIKLFDNSGDFGYPDWEWEFQKIYVDEDAEGYRIIYQDSSYNGGKEIDITPLLIFKDE